MSQILGCAFNDKVFKDILLFLRKGYVRYEGIGANTREGMTVLKNKKITPVVKMLETGISEATTTWLKYTDSRYSLKSTSIKVYHLYVVVAITLM